MKAHFGRPSPAMIVALFALVVAMSGSAFAVVSAKSGDTLIAKHTLSGDRLRPNSITGREVAENTLKAPLKWHNLKLIHNWQNYNGNKRAPAWALDSNGIVHFRGAIDQTGGSNQIFTHVPKSIRPKADVWLVTDTVNAANGRIDLYATGEVYIEDLNSGDDAASFTNLDGVTYSLH